VCVYEGSQLVSRGVTLGYSLGNSFFPFPLETLTLLVLLTVWGGLFEIQMLSVFKTNTSFSIENLHKYIYSVYTAVMCV
jgi:hypothetical protein